MFWQIVLGIILFIIAVSIVWRFFSRYFNLPCPAWFYWLVEFDNPFAKANSTNVVIEQLQIEPGMKVVDAGCGPGRITIPLAKKMKDGTVVAMDIQSGMLERVKEKAQVANINNITTLRAGIGEGKLEHNTYDRAVISSVLGEIPDQKKALQELFSALKPGGMLVVTETRFDPHFQKKEHVLNLAKAIGFQEKSWIGNSLAYTLQLKKPRNS